MSFVTLERPGATVLCDQPYSNKTTGGVIDGGAEGSVHAKESSVPSKGCIVIVEPDELIRELLERWLGEAGYQVVTTNKNHEMPMVMPAW